MAGYARDRDGSRRPVEIPQHAIGISHSDGTYSRGRITSRRTHLMPSYEATPAELEQYGSKLNIWQQLALLQAWSPLIGFGQRLVNESDPYKKSLIVADAAEWLASKTDAQADNQLVKLLGDIVRAPQGEALVRWCLIQVEAAR
jgi:hypothetical protein